MDTHNIDICPIEWYGYALKSVRDISRICEEEMRESNHMRDITHLYPTIWSARSFCDLFMTCKSVTLPVAEKNSYCQPCTAFFQD